MTLDNLEARERRYLEALADAYMEAPPNSNEEATLDNLLDVVFAKLLLGECDRTQVMNEASDRARRYETAHAALGCGECGPFTCSRCGTSYVVEALDPIDASSDREESEVDEPAKP